MINNKANKQDKIKTSKKSKINNGIKIAKIILNYLSKKFNKNIKILMKADFMNGRLKKE